MEKDKKNKKNTKNKMETTEMQSRRKEVELLKDAYKKGKLKFDSKEVAQSILDDKEIIHGLFRKPGSKNKKK